MEKLQQPWPLVKTASAYGNQVSFVQAKEWTTA